MRKCGVGTPAISLLSCDRFRLHMKRCVTSSRASRGCFSALAALASLLAAGCATPPAGGGRVPAAGWLQPPHTTTLHTVLQHEIGRSRCTLPDYRCTVGAHRGASLAHRENTLAALRAAEADPRSAFIEFDVQYTRDNQIVLFHDRTLLRLFGSLRSVRRATYAELAAATKGEIARYEEAMPLLRKRLNIEIKARGDEEEDRRLVDAVIADVRARGRAREVLISSISDDVVRYVKQVHPDMATGQIFWLTASTYLHLDGLTERLYGQFGASQADYLLLHVANLRNIEDLIKLKPPGKTIAFWDFDDRMYLVHKDLSDRLWGTGAVSEFGRRLRYHLR